jgi:hypothetical protein
MDHGRGGALKKPAANLLLKGRFRLLLFYLVFNRHQAIAQMIEPELLHQQVIWFFTWISPSECTIRKFDQGFT